MALKNYYTTLGLTSTASPEEIKKAYHKLSLKFHPDKNDGDEFLMDMFKSINEANEVLSNPEKRKVYDNKLKDAEEVKKRDDFAEDRQANSDFRPGTEAKDFQNIHALWNLYLEKKKRTDKAYGNLVAVRSYDAPRYVTTQKVLTSMLALLLVWLFFKPTANSEVTTNEVTSNKWVTTQSAKVYKKPNIQSKVVGELPVGEKVDALDETNYFLKINFVNSGGSSSKAYVMKSAMIKNQ